MEFLAELFDIWPLYDTISFEEQGDNNHLPAVLLKNILLNTGAEQRLHLLHQLDDSWVVDAVIDKVGVLTIVNNSLAAKDVEVLGYVGIGGLYLLSDITHRHFFVLEQAENLQADWMRHGFQEFGHCLYLFVFHGEPLKLKFCFNVPDNVTAHSLEREIGRVHRITLPC